MEFQKDMKSITAMYTSKDDLTPLLYSGKREKENGEIFHYI